MFVLIQILGSLLHFRFSEKHWQTELQLFSISEINGSPPRGGFSLVDILVMSNFFFCILRTILPSNEQTPELLLNIVQCPEPLLYNCLWVIQSTHMRVRNTTSSQILNTDLSLFWIFHKFPPWFFKLILILKRTYSFLCVLVFNLYVCKSTTCTQWSEQDAIFFETRVNGGCEPPSESWELNTGPLVGQQVL